MSQHGVLLRKRHFVDTFNEISSLFVVSVCGQNNLYLLADSWRNSYPSSKDLPDFEVFLSLTNFVSGSRIATTGHIELSFFNATL